MKAFRCLLMNFLRLHEPRNFLISFLVQLTLLHISRVDRQPHAVGRAGELSCNVSLVVPSSGSRVFDSIRQLREDLCEESFFEFFCLFFFGFQEARNNKQIVQMSRNQSHSNVQLSGSRFCKRGVCAVIDNARETTDEHA